jgi:PIN domain nuclease of toxin-antitoxin system
MPKYLLDTHTLIWMHQDSPEISPKIKSKLQSHDAGIFLSVASLWEITIKQQSGKLDLQYSLYDIAFYCLDNQIVITPVSLLNLSKYSTLPLLHKDPFDRMIVATAAANNLILVSKDKQLSAYNIEVIW